MRIYNNNMFVGREYELKILKNAIKSKRPELGIVYGRRRVGKSALLKQAKSGKNCIYFEALQKVTQKKQIEHFLQQLSKQANTPQSMANNWRDAFEILTYYISKGGHYIVFDEFPWMASGKTELVSLFKYYWDNHWKNNPGITLMLCGSIASYMIKHVVHSQALHNRKTFEIKLSPLPAKEAKLFFKNLRSDREIAQFMMVFGGIPKYLEQIDPTQSLDINVDKLCFQKSGFFVAEFETIFKEQFKKTRYYERIVSVLSKKSVSKINLSNELNIASGGGFNTYITSLEQADFIRLFSPKALLGKGDKTQKLVLWDEWLRFYFTYIQERQSIIELNTSPGLFQKACSNSIESYFGNAFEKFCIKNLTGILNALEVNLHDVISFGPFFRQRSRNNPSEKGLQIDILIHRRGNILTLIECKFGLQPVGKTIISEIQHKVALLSIPKNYTLELVLIAAAGITPVLEQEAYFHRILGLECLFE
ncbi:MAG: AAA family ATPase [Fibrobacteria bacterium]|nr:AAA family ATPase [Fibrobacteria bacterium]